MGPNTVTGHLSVIYTVECQILLVLSLLQPILHTSQPPSLLSALNPLKLLESDPSPSPSSTITTGINSTTPAYVTVTSTATARHTAWLQRELRKLVWSSGCTSWALDPTTGVNVAMYPQYQFWFWWRCLFVREGDFEYAFPKVRGADGDDGAVVNGKGEESLWRMRKVVVGDGWVYVRRAVWGVALLSVLAGLVVRARRSGVRGRRDVQAMARRVIEALLSRGRQVAQSLRG